MNKDIDNHNAKGDLHGYNEWYNVDGSLRIRTNWKNDKEIGYEEFHGYHRLYNNKQTNYYIR